MSMKLSVYDDVILRMLELGDAADIFKTIDSERRYLGRWLPFVAYSSTIDDTRSFVRSVLGAPQEKLEPVFTIRKGDRFVGLIGLKGTDPANRKTEIGYWLSESFQGQGIVSRSVKRLCEYAFVDLEMNRVQIKCAVGNESSNAVPKRLGFAFEGVERAGELFPDGRYADIEVYSLLKREWLHDEKR